MLMSLPEGAGDEDTPETVHFSSCGAENVNRRKELMQDKTPNRGDAQLWGQDPVVTLGLLPLPVEAKAAGRRGEPCEAAPPPAPAARDPPPRPAPARPAARPHKGRARRAAPGSRRWRGGAPGGQRERGRSSAAPSGRRRIPGWRLLVLPLGPGRRRRRRRRRGLGRLASMGEDGAAGEARPEGGGASPVPSGSRSPSLQPAAGGSGGASAGGGEGGAQVNAITVLTLLDKLVHMLEAVQEKQQRMEGRQLELEAAVKGVQGDLGKLCKSHASTSNTVAKLLEKSRKVSAHTRDVRERMDRQCAQVKRLEHNHAQLLRRNHFKVLIFQEENEIPASVFVKEPVPSITEGKEEPVDENKTLEDTMHTVELSSEDEAHHDEDGADDSLDEKMEETRAEKIKRSSLKKVDSLKKAFSRQNIEKKMNKIVSPERREKIKKSFTPNHQKSTSSKSSSFKVSPLTFNVKKVREGDAPAETEEKPAEATGSEQAVNDEETSFTEIPSDLISPTSPAEEGKAFADSLEKETRSEEEAVVNNNVELAIVEEDEDYGASVRSRREYYEEGNAPVSRETEQSDEESNQAAVLQLNQTA
uniref:caveolae-associated protein 2 n=1 Tax=Euleptes europaea TaxID=460621 RepID=UPI0025421C9D|nr:caveolae-associated protein 2 [Euleptes europaea]